ncbi:MAG TPA: hypothetical protein VN645_02205, partial [Steroidobacteraceae bacterium]|nr:hypothetical protein [Steroidobacteraceae bacterium]
MSNLQDQQRRSFIHAAVGATATGAEASLDAKPSQASETEASGRVARPADGPARSAGSGGQFTPIGAEVTIFDCPIEG